MACALLFVLGGTGEAVAQSYVETGVTNGLGNSRHPFDKASQRKVVRTRFESPFDPWVYLVYSRVNSGTGRNEVVLARSTTLFHSTNEKVVLFGQGGAVVNSATTDFVYPALDASVDGRQLHVAVLDQTNGDVLYTRNASLSGTGWQTAWAQAGGGTSPRYDTISTSAYGTDTAPALAVDASSRPHIAWARADGSARPNLYYRTWQGSWSAETNLSGVTGTGTLPQALDPSIDWSNGFVHVLYKDDASPNDATAKTDRYRYVRNQTSGSYATLLAPVTVMQPTTNDIGHPGSLAATGSSVFVVGTATGSGSDYSWSNHSTDDGATWLQGPAGQNFECVINAFPLVVGLDPYSSDHRLKGVRAGTLRFTRQYWFTNKWGNGGTCSTNNNWLDWWHVGDANDVFHVSIEKRKLNGENDFFYCFYNTSNNFTLTQPEAVDAIVCERGDTGFPIGPRTFYRSIGTAPDYGTNATICPTCTTGLGTTANATRGSRIVTGNGTQWLTANRGRGDVMRLGGPSYMVKAVLSDTMLVLEQPVTFGAAPGLDYSLRRQETRLQDWANCIAQSTGGICRFFDPASADLVSDDRAEIGVAYADSPFLHSTGGTAPGTPVLSIDATTTDPLRKILLTADGSNRHYGIPGAGVVIDNEANNSVGAMFVYDDYVTVEWLEVRNGGGTAYGIDVSGQAAGGANDVTLRQMLVHDTPGDGIHTIWPITNFRLSNSIVYNSGGDGIRLAPGVGPPAVTVTNNTVFGSTGAGVLSTGTTNATAVTLTNNIAHSNTGGDFAFPDTAPLDGLPDLLAGANNFAGDATGVPHSPGGGGRDLVPLAGGGGLNFFNQPGNDFHLTGTSGAMDAGIDASGLMAPFDVDGELRPGGALWDVGADEFSATTLVELVSFEAWPADSAVDLAWQTASELDNLGFHVYRSLSEAGPWERITLSLIPGLGSSPQGASYSWTDTDLVNGTPYYYRLEDIDTASVSTFHGPVSAVPRPAPGGGSEGGGEGGGSGPEAPLPTDPEPTPPGEGGNPPEDPGECPDEGPCLFGDPGEPSLRVVDRSAHGMTVELHTPGFVAILDPVGVRVQISGFAIPTHARAVDLPFKRVVLDGVVGRRARLVSIEALSETSWNEVAPAVLGPPAVDARPDGTVRPVRPRLPVGPSASTVPRAHLAGSAFMGQAKKIALEVYPLRWDPSQARLVLSRTLRMRIAFSGEAPGEGGAGSLGRRDPRTRRTTPVVFAHLHSTGRGLHAVPYEAIFPRAGRPLPLEALRLVRGGSVVPVHVEPPTGTFGPGSVLYFHVDQQAASTAFSGELSFALERTSGGIEMARGPAEPLTGPLGSAPLRLALFEANRIYQSGLLLAPDVWLWDFAQSGMAKNLALELEGVDLASPLPARVRVFLQGASDAGGAGEHHVSFSFNGVSLGETSFEGMVPHLFEGTIAASALIEGTNTLTFTNVGDTGVVSRVFLDRVEVDYPETSALRAGRFSGAWTEEGVAEVGLGAPSHSEGLRPGSGPEESARPTRWIVDSSSHHQEQAPRNDYGLVTSFSSVFALDVTDPASPVWLSGLEPGPGSIRMQVSPGRRYQVITPDGLLVPRVSHPVETGLRDTRNQADYVLVAPRVFMDAAQPLLLRRESQGLTTFAASLEDIAQDFGGGAPSAEAIRDFLAFAFHSWQQPSPRYVLLLGDASFDPRNFTGFDQGAPLPALWTKTSYLWTASDPAIAAVNGEDLLPDLALGRLPATNLQQAHALVQKVLDWEDAGYDFSGEASLVADNPDLAGDFEADIADIEQSFLAPRNPQSLLVRTLGGTTRPAILDAMNGGLSLLSYVGHGGAAVWASENVLNSFDPPALLAQPRQPLMLTMNCLNGYFVQPNLDSLAEAFLKAEGRGTIAAFSPSGLSLDGPAHVFHRALMNEIVNGNHERLGNAVLAAQQAYALSGHMPELLGIYNLFGDPAMRIRR